MEHESQNVVITDIKMPFLSMVILMVKWTLAAIPALIIIGLIFGALGVGITMLASMLGVDLSGFVPPQ